MTDLATALRQAGLPGTAPRKRRRAATGTPERKPRSYRESDFQREFNRFCQPGYRRTKAADGTVTTELLYPGPGWDYLHIVNQPWVEGATRVQQRKPYDCRFTAPRQHPMGGTIAESHACELKVCRTESLPFAAVHPHQWDALRQAERMGANSFGWVIALFFPHSRELHEVYAARVCWLDTLRRWGDTSASLGWLRRHAVRLHPVDCNPWRSDKKARRGWDPSPLIRGQPPAA